MTDSLILFFGTLVFIAFGYICFVRIAFKTYSNLDQATQSETLPFITQLFNHLGQGALFVHFASIGLLLFWGWGAALIWLVIFHLFTETMVNLQHSRVVKPQKKSQKSFSDKLLHRIRQLFLVLILSVGTALIINLVNQQTGLVFILLAIFIAHSFIVEEFTITTVVLSVVVLLIGLWFSHELGISMYGSISPLDGFINQQIIRDYFVWLVFDNTSVISLAVIIGVFMLARREHFRSDLSIMSGVLVVVLLCAFLVKLVWLRPIVDAPLNSLRVREAGLPPLSSFALFIFAGCSALLFRETSTDNSTRPKASFSNLQLSNLITLFTVVLIVLALASALGIGAWSTHYLDWNNNGQLYTHFELAMRSAADLIYTQSSVGNFTYSLFVSGLAIISFACLLNIVSKLSPPRLVKSKREKSILNKFRDSQILPVIVIYIISSLLLQHGISIKFWILIGMLAWLLVAHQFIQTCVTQANNSRGLLAQNVFALLFLLVGEIQLIWTIIRWSLSQDWLFAIAAGLIFICLIPLFKDQIKPLLATFGNSDSKTLFR